MPAGDRTGPWGEGSRTGRGLGFCSGYNAPGFAAPGGRGQGFGRGRAGGRGRGFGRGLRGGAGFGPGRGYGYGYGYGYPAPGAGVTEGERDQQLEALHTYVAELDSVLGDIKKRLDELAPKKKDNNSEE